MEKIKASIDLINQTIEEYKPIKVYGLFSGGHDSLTATYVASLSQKFDAAVHINTGIGIEETRQFVRQTCSKRNWPLIELYPDIKSYDDLVLDKGFPRGPKSHCTMYYWLKQRQVRRLVREAKTKKMDKVLLITGIRVEESRRRMMAKIATPVYKFGAQIWVNPILDWTASDCNQVIFDAGLDRNPVVDFLHRSGECLCGAFARAKDIEEIRMWYPETAKRIAELERKCREKGLVDCVWAGYPKGIGRKTISGPLCIGCSDEDETR